MIRIMHTNCCGIKEIHNITGLKPKTIVDEVTRQWRDGSRRTAFFFFSTVSTVKAGKALAAYIEEKKLGVVTKMPTKRNPNSGNQLDMWVWAVDEKALLNKPTLSAGFFSTIRCTNWL